MSIKTLVIIQNKGTGMWIAGFNKDGSPVMSPKIQDSYLFLNGFGAGAYSSRNWNRETITIRAFKPPRPRPWKPKKVSKKRSTAKKTVKTEEVVATET